jgi:hypothetical protein
MSDRHARFSDVPLQNRVTPDGHIIATTARGTFMGNRGILHDDNRNIVRTSRNTMWLICRVEFKGRRRQLMKPGSYTELFFLDEAVALAAGHRPCGECRRTEYRSFMAASSRSDEPLTCPKDLDRALSRSRSAKREFASITSLPDGAFVRRSIHGLWLIWEGSLHRWTPDGYVDAVAIGAAAAESAEVVTPALTVAALRHGYRVEVHPTAQQSHAAPPGRRDDPRTSAPTSG